MFFLGCGLLRAQGSNLHISASACLLLAVAVPADLGIAGHQTDGRAGDQGRWVRIVSSWVRPPAIAEEDARSMGAVAVGLLAGAVADRVAGDPRRGHPVAAFGSVAAALERRAWRPTRTVGAAHVLALVGGVAGVAALADRRLRRRPAARV